MVDKMVGSTFIQVPPDVTDARTLKRFLDKLVLQLDVAFGNRGNNSFATNTQVLSNVGSLQELINILNEQSLTYSLVDGTRPYTNVVSYSKDNVLKDLNLVHKKYTTDTFEPKFDKNTAFNKNFGTTSGTVTEGGTTTNNPIQPAITDLGLTISNPPTQAQVQQISNKVDSILAILRSTNIIEI